MRPTESARRKAAPRPDSSSAYEFVAGTVDGKDPARVLGILLEMFAELDDMVVDGTALDIPLDAPDFLEQFFPGNHLIALLPEQLHDHEAVLGEAQGFPVHLRFEGLEIDV